MKLISVRIRTASGIIEVHTVPANTPLRVLFPNGARKI